MTGSTRCRIERILKMQYLILGHIINHRLSTTKRANHRTLLIFIPIFILVLIFFILLILPILNTAIKYLLCQKLQQLNIPVLCNLREIIM